MPDSSPPAYSLQRARVPVSVSVPVSSTPLATDAEISKILKTFIKSGARSCDMPPRLIDRVWPYLQAKRLAPGPEPSATGDRYRDEDRVFGEAHRALHHSVDPDYKYLWIKKQFFRIVGNDKHGHARFELQDDERRRLNRCLVALAPPSVCGGSVGDEEEDQYEGREEGGEEDGDDVPAAARYIPKVMFSPGTASGSGAGLLGLNCDTGIPVRRSSNIGVARHHDSYEDTPQRQSDGPQPTNTHGKGRGKHVATAVCPDLGTSSGLLSARPRRLNHHRRTGSSLTTSMGSDFGESMTGAWTPWAATGAGDTAAVDEECDDDLNGMLLPATDRFDEDVGDFTMFMSAEDDEEGVDNTGSTSSPAAVRRRRRERNASPSPVFPGTAHAQHTSGPSDVRTLNRKMASTAPSPAPRQNTTQKLHSFKPRPRPGSRATAEEVQVGEQASSGRRPFSEGVFSSPAVQAETSLFDNNIGHRRGGSGRRDAPWAETTTRPAERERTTRSSWVRPEDTQEMFDDDYDADDDYDYELPRFKIQTRDGKSSSAGQAAARPSVTSANPGANKTTTATTTRPRPKQPATTMTKSTPTPTQHSNAATPVITTNSPSAPSASPPTTNTATTCSPPEISARLEDALSKAQHHKTAWRLYQACGRRYRKRLTAVTTPTSVATSPAAVANNGASPASASVNQAAAAGSVDRSDKELVKKLTRSIAKEKKHRMMHQVYKARVKRFRKETQQQSQQQQ